MKSIIYLLIPLALMSAENKLFATDLVGESLSIVAPDNVTQNSNTIASSSSSALIGWYNYLLNGTGALGVGGNNYIVEAFGSIVAGSLNESSNTYYGFIGGQYNYVEDTYESIVTGENNYASGNSSILVLGKGLIAQGADAAAIIGSYNATRNNQLFIVANGTDASHPHNAMEIFKNGDVKIPKRQGDLGMGRFGNAGDE